ncbi:MAG TPA: response regulator transcription factor [Verrucomicrobiae bacterium]
MSTSASHEKKAKILVVDDHPLLREGVMQLINRQRDLCACGDASSLAEAQAALETLQPDLILLDLRLGGGDALEFIKASRARFPRVRILILSQHDEPLYAERTMRVGASGYVIKEEAPEEVLTAIRTVLSGDTYVSRRIAALVLQRMIPAAKPANAPRLEDLTDREFTVFQLIGSGLGSREIAEQLGLSVKTIETHRENIKQKRGLKNAADLVREATDWVRQHGSTGG